MKKMMKTVSLRYFCMRLTAFFVFRSEHLTNSGLVGYEFFSIKVIVTDSSKTTDEKILDSLFANETQC